MVDYKIPNKPKAIRRGMLQHVVEGSTGWFDEAAVASGNCSGACGILKISDHIISKWTINCGPGTNTREKLFGAWALLTLSSRFAILELLVHGDSKIVIDWLRGNDSLQVLTLECWKGRLSDLIKLFHNVSFEHIYHEDNSKADMLSKQALLKASGKIEYFQCEGDHEDPHLYLDLY
jgi:hypothetical protein